MRTHCRLAWEEGIPRKQSPAGAVSNPFRRLGTTPGAVATGSTGYKYEPHVWREGVYVKEIVPIGFPSLVVFEDD